MNDNTVSEDALKPIPRKELVRRIASESGLNLRDAERALRAVERTIVEAVAAREVVRVGGLGTFRPVWRGESVFRSPHNQRRMFVDGRWQMAFKPSAPVRRIMAALTPTDYRSEAHQRAWRLAETLLGDLAAYHRSAPPPIIPADSDDARVREACEAAFGGQWTRATQTWVTQTPPEVASRRDYLVAAARRRWGRG